MSDRLKPARVRFAPSPTGYLHLGGLRTALFNWLYARRTGGQFILRIEDTDQSRFNPESRDDIMRGLRWLGLDWDEGPDVGGPYGPYVQSERKPLYRQYAEQLVASGHAYKSYTPVEAWEAASPDEEEAEGAQPQRKPYDRRDRYLTEAERAAYEAEGRPYAIRFAAPLDGVTKVKDLLRGEISFPNKSLIDQVLLKSDGMPTYHLAMAVDDHLMGITHVIRAEEWLPSAPIHKLIFDALGWEMPTLIHVPIILNPDGSKMSKRERGSQVRAYIEAGYLPEALFNFLCNIGWNYDAEQEVFSREQAIERFDVADINPKPAALNYDKLKWLNGVYMRNLSPAELHRRLAPYLAKQLGLDEEQLLHSEQLSELVPLVQERIKLLTDAAEFLDWAFRDAAAITYPDLSLFTAKKKLTLEQALAVLETSADLIANLEEFTVPRLESEFRAKAETMGIKVGPFLTPLRVAITGKEVSPPLFESMVVLGRAETGLRFKNAIVALREAISQSV
jgi:glutamyl-tRNA synthetase